MDQKNLKLPIIFFVVGLVIGFLIGYYLVGRNVGFKGTSTQQLEDLVAISFPKPLEDLRTVIGPITKIEGNKIQIEIGDPEDYLPHTDGSPQRTISRVAVVNQSTEMYVIRPMKIDKNGNISRETLKLGDLKTGETVTVTASQNVRKASQFDAVLIEKVVF